MHRVYTSIVLCALLSVSLVACDDEEAQEEAPPAEEEVPEVDEAPDELEEAEEPEQAADLHPIWGDWSSQDALDAVQGQWVTRSHTGDVQTRWTIDGEAATFQRGDAEPEEGTVEFEQPGAMTFSVETNGGTSSQMHSFAREGEDLYLGLGHGGVVLEDRMVLRSGRELVVYRDGDCTYHESSMFDGFEEDGDEIECGIEEDSGQRFFVYTEPDGGTEYTIDQGIEIGEDSLMDSQLKQSPLESAQ